MADKYTQEDAAQCGIPIPVPLRAGEHVIPHYRELLAKGHGHIIDGITGRNTATFTPIIMYNDEDTED